MTEQRGCPTCKHNHLDGDEEPCLHCTHAYSDPQADDFGLAVDDCYEPKAKPTNGDWLRSSTDDEVAEFLARLLGVKSLKSMFYEWLQKERNTDG